MAWKCSAPMWTLNLPEANFSGEVPSGAQPARRLHFIVEIWTPGEKTVLRGAFESRAQNVRWILCEERGVRTYRETVNGGQSLEGFDFGGCAGFSAISSRN